MSISADALVFWSFAVAWLVVLVLLVFVVLPSGVREARRIVMRVLGLVDSPLPLQLEKAEADIERVQAALDSIPQLRRRAALALELIRTTPLVPPALVDLRARIAREIRAFRRELR